MIEYVDKSREEAISIIGEGNVKALEGSGLAVIFEADAAYVQLQLLMDRQKRQYHFRYVLPAQQKAEAEAAERAKSPRMQPAPESRIITPGQMVGPMGI